MFYIVNYILLLTVVVYLVGHGVYEAGQQYFIPVDSGATPNIDNMLCCEMLIKEVLKTKPKLLAVFLDMCRM